MSAVETVRFVFEAELPREFADKFSNPAAGRVRGHRAMAIGALERAFGLVTWSRADAEKVRDEKAETLAETARSLAPPDDPIQSMTDDEAEVEAGRWLDERLIEGKGRSILVDAFRRRLHEGAGS